MGQVITAARPYFHWATRYHQAPSQHDREEVLRNQLSALKATEANPHIQKRLGNIFNPNPEGSPNADVQGTVIQYR